MQFKKGYIKIGKVPKVQAIYNEGIITFYYNNGSGISKKKLNLAQKTLTDGESTDMFYDRAVETPLKAIAVKGSNVICY